MKIRNGFVSNSSSSSFLILGFNIDDEVLYERLQEKYYEDFEFYAGDEEGYVMGVYPTRYLKEEKLDDACETAFKYIQRLMDKKDFEDLMNDKYVKRAESKLTLIYDSYYS